MTGLHGSLVPWDIRNSSENVRMELKKDAGCMEPAFSPEMLSPEVYRLTSRARTGDVQDAAVFYNS